jgi:hypothetical protein
MGSIDIHDVIISRSDQEDSKTLILFKQLGHLKDQGYLEKHEAVSILKWKSPRPLKRYLLNTEKEFIEITRLAYGTSSDLMKIHILTALQGVSIPAASALLMFLDKINYPVIDIRVWKVLYFAKLVQVNPRGQGFTLKQWSEYLEIIRKLAQDHDLSARQVEKRLFDYHKSTQNGNLYK